MRGSRSLYAQNFGLNGYTAQEAALLESFWQHEAACYVQDQFRPTSRLTIGLGLRYDAADQSAAAGRHRRRAQVPVGPPVVSGNEVQLTYAPVPQGIPHDRNNWGPRGDVAYQLTGDGSTMVKGSAGLYLRPHADDLLPAARRRRQQHDAVRAAVALRRDVPEVLPSAIEPGSALATLRRSAGDLVCRSRTSRIRASSS